MINTVYLDYFANEYVLEKESIAAPERYLEVNRGKDEFIESWRLKNNFVANIYCDANSYKEKINDLREQTEESMGFELSRLVSWEVPEDIFKEILKGMNIKEGSDI